MVHWIAEYAQTANLRGASNSREATQRPRTRSIPQVDPQLNNQFEHLRMFPEQRSAEAMAGRRTQICLVAVIAVSNPSRRTASPL
jgi:hypothetical protein